MSDDLGYSPTPVVHIQQVDNGGQVPFVPVPTDDPAAARLLARHPA